MSGPDSELMLEFQRTGDEALFEEIVSKYQKPLINFFYRLMWDRTEAEDLAQEVFCRIFVHRKSYEAKAKFSTYLFRIARNLWIDHSRTQGKQPHMTSLSMPVHQDGRGEELIDTIPAPQQEMPESDTQVARRLQNALEQLSEEQRLVFILAKDQKMKYAEIADTLRIPLGTVRSRMHSAVQRLQALLRNALD